MPSVPLRDVRKLESEEIKASYRNIIGFGKSCEEATRELEQLRQKIEHITKETPEYIYTEKELLRATEEKIEFCRQQLNELSTLDDVKVEIEYTPMPEYIRRYSKVLDVAIKTVLLPYITKLESRETHNRIVIDLKFIPHLYAVDMEVMTEEGTVKYHHIRIPETLREVIPLVATEQPMVELVSRIKGSPLYPMCRIGEDVVKSFDNTTYRYELDDCYHVLVADSSRQHFFSVLGKEVEGKKEVKIFVHETEIVLKPTSIEVDGQPIQIRPKEHKEIPTKSHTTVVKIIRSSDDVFILETPYVRIIFDGKIIEIKNTKLVVERELKGLCGSSNGDRRYDIMTPTSHVAPTYSAAAVSYRIEKSCSPLPKEKQQFKRQLSSCTIPKVEKV